MGEANPSPSNPTSGAFHSGLAWLTYGPLRDFGFVGRFGPDTDENRKTIEAFLATGRDDLLAVVSRFAHAENGATRQSVLGANSATRGGELLGRSLSAESLAFLGAVPDLRSLTLWSLYPGIGNGQCITDSPLYQLTKLEALDVQLFDQRFDWSRLKQLKELHWRQSLWSSTSIIGCLGNLERLVVTQYVPRGKSLADLPDFPKLTSLGIKSSSVQILSGLTRWQKLEQLVLADLPRIRSLAPLAECMALRHLTIHRSRQLADHQLAVYLPNLEYLQLSGCGMIESLDFLDDMPKLKHINFCGTGVMDGDLRPLFRLQSARFWPRRNFSHSPRQIEEINREVHGRD